MTYEVGQRVEVERWAAGIDAQALDGPTWTPATVVGGHSFSYTLDVDGCGEGFIAVPVWLRPAGIEGHTAIAGRSIEHMIVDDLGPPAPESNATCRCGAPSLRLFTSHECSRGPECPIVAGEPEPEMYVRTRRGERIYVATGEGYIAEHPLREGAIAAWRAKVAAKPKVAIGVDLATGPDRAAMVVGRVVDATPDADGRVTIQWRAPVMVGAMQRDAMWGVRR